MKAIQVLCVLMFEGTGAFQIVTGSLLILGLWQIFRKCGFPGWMALIPGWREYVLARCASREDEGRVLFIACLGYLAFTVADDFMPATASLNAFQTLLFLIFSFFRIIYRIRISIGLTKVFGRKKRWAILWSLVGSLTAAIWGFNPHFQPEWRESDIRQEVDSYFSGTRSEIMENGLTVNLEKRTAREFLTVKTLLRDIHMGIEPGHMVLLLGGSGAGKTTLLNAVNGYEKADAEVFLNGGNVYSEYKQMQYEIGFVPQQDLTRFEDTVLFTLRDAAMLRLPVEFSAADREARVQDVMNTFGLTAVKDSLVGKLSGGQRKRLSIAMEFLSNPSLFILDEPDSGLDGVMARELMEELRKIADSGKIVIVITHTPDRVIDLFDDLIVLAKDASGTGRLAWFGPVDKARTFFGCPEMEQIVLRVNRKDEGGEGRADEFIRRYSEELCHA